MRKLTELTSSECQIFLDEYYNGGKYSKIIIDIPQNEFLFNDDDNKGIEYEINEQKKLVPFNDLDLIMWLYKNNIDITTPLNKLKVDYLELDEANSTFFEYAMEMNKFINSLIEQSDINGQLLKNMKKIQKEMIKKL